MVLFRGCLVLRGWDYPVGSWGPSLMVSQSRLIHGCFKKDLSLSDRLRCQQWPSLPEPHVAMGPWVRSWWITKNPRTQRQQSRTKKLDITQIHSRNPRRSWKNRTESTWNPMSWCFTTGVSWPLPCAVLAPMRAGRPRGRPWWHHLLGNNLWYPWVEYGWKGISCIELWTVVLIIFFPSLHHLWTSVGPTKPSSCWSRLVSRDLALVSRDATALEAMAFQMAMGKPGYQWSHKVYLFSYRML